jgi:hypothetical protein
MLYAPQMHCSDKLLKCSGWYKFNKCSGLLKFHIIDERSDLLFSRSFNYLRFPCFNLPPKPPSQILPFSPSIPFPRRTCHTHVLPNSTSSSTPAPQQPEQDDVNVISSTCKLSHLTVKFLSFFLFIYWVLSIFNFG